MRHLEAELRLLASIMRLLDPKMRLPWRIRATLGPMARTLPGRDANLLITQGMVALGLTQERLGTLLMASRRTVSRWASGRSSPTADTLARLAVAVYPTDSGLAARLAVESGQTLESLGLVAPSPPAAPAPPPRAFPPTALVVEAVVCAVAEAMQVPPSVAREALRAALARAQALGLSVEEMSEALSPPPPASSDAPSSKGTTRGKRAPPGG
ncbi:MAG TPA: helix-turn-helix transcriptional regulator [Polyangiaceae bacterium]|nr:helix-turn-helix transcriptional regulator [Polyangiaceae bacterium]